ncbi:MAG: DotI/IcmL/TraM family protein, partial [Gammaproteobacteria bacterium]|nr:DotI/IcmL/TraM family protein [Gammaproteobacteria bacterium]
MSDDFDRKNSRLMRLIAVVVFLNIIVICIAFYVQTHLKDPPYYQIWRQTNGKLAGQTMPPLAGPIINQQSLLHWCENAASAIYTYDQAHYQEQIQDAIN